MMAGNILMYFSLKDEQEMMQSLVIRSYYVEIVCQLLELLSLIIHQSCLLGRVGFNVQNDPEWRLSPCSLTSSSHFIWEGCEV